MRPGRAPVVPRVLAICLDGYEESVGRRLMAEGAMPALRDLAGASARFALDHGSALRTGLAGEHVATGLSPQAAGRWAAVRFDAATHTVRQEGTALAPFTAQLDARAVVFDPPYFELARASATRGLVGWGAHDPGVACTAQPAALLEEVRSRFGRYPAHRWIYATPWNSPAASQEMGERLAQGVRTRARLARWLFAERLPDWDLALLTVSEAHSALEGLWHGIDADHPLHRCASAAAAAGGIRAVYTAIDALIGELRGAFPDAITVVFSMHGMGPNRSDAASMLLLPELLYRHAFGTALFQRQGVPSPLLQGQATLGEGESWDGWVAAGFPHSAALPSNRDRGGPRILSRIIGRLGLAPARTLRVPLDWMPAARYQPFWPRMPAFALPSFYDGRVRINLRGRERGGVIAPDQYRTVREELVSLLEACRDPVSGESVVAEVEYPAAMSAREVGPTEADLVILWRGAPMGMRHPRYGQIGPIPYRRTGGHTGGLGFALLQGERIAAGEYGTRSAYDVVPTLFELLGRAPVPGLSGSSLLRPLRLAS
ncbi:MAG: hypothetical protein JO341_11690 [Gammaproteobacteria bacterium]|nr:hypothetical protein [Gammaproteobacteria bacterium]